MTDGGSPIDLTIDQTITFDLNGSLTNPSSSGTYEVYMMFYEDLGGDTTVVTGGVTYVNVSGGGGGGGDYGYDTYYDTDEIPSAFPEAYCSTTTSVAGETTDILCRVEVGETYNHDSTTGEMDLAFEQADGTEPFGVTLGSLGDWTVTVNPDTTADVLTILGGDVDDWADNTLGNDDVWFDADLYNGSGHVTVSPGDTVEIHLTGNNLTLPSTAGSYEIYIMTFASDELMTEFSEVTLVVQDEAPEVSVNLGTVLTMTVSGVNSGEGCGTREPVMDVTTDATTINWRDITINQKTTACQQLTITTNANNGYNVYLVQDGDLTHVDGGSAVSAFDDAGGTGNANEAIWTSPGTENGHFGVGSDDTDAMGGTDMYMGIPTQSGDTLDTSAKLCDGSGPVQSQECSVEYAIEVTPLQESGEYFNLVEYVIVAELFFIYLIFWARFSYSPGVFWLVVLHTCFV